MAENGHMTFGATVKYSGGGMVSLFVDRDTVSYPEPGSHVVVNQLGAEEPWGHEAAQVKWLRDRLANIEELHSSRRLTLDGYTLLWCRECRQDHPCPTVELARG